MEVTNMSSPPHDGTAAELPEAPKANVSAPADALTPPTSEDMDNHNKMDDASSDLSDLDMDLDEEEEEEEEEEIVPDHYYGGGNVPVFKPTMEQFRDFEKFIAKVNDFGMKSGIVKVIPPKEWRDELPDLSQLVKGIKVKNPIMQEFMGTHGTYTQANIEKQRSYNLPEWKALTEEPQHQPPARRGERRRNQEKVVRGGGNTRGRNAPPKAEKPEQSTGPRRRGRPRKNPVLATSDKESTEEPEKNTQVPPTPTSPSRKVVESVEEEATPTKAKPKPRPRGRPPKNGGQAKSVSSRRMNNTTEKNDIVDEAAFEDFDYKMDKEELDAFTQERCAELETAYWKSVTFAQPMYGADMPGSLFEDDTKSWNVANLPNLLDVLGTKIPGVNTAYLYLGMWKATFAWHLEDVDLYSINYIHFGAPKQWYSISQADARKFEAAMRAIWPNDSKNCDQFLRHKTYLISPELLQRQYGIKVNKLVHYEGEFVITYPYGYHSGYNLGYNCAESVNFATEGWLEYGRIARKCDCEADSVWVDVADIERKLRGEPTPEYYEETDDEDEDDLEPETGDLPSPPASIAGKPKANPRKRKRQVKEESEKKKKTKRVKIRIKTSTREPCVLCPNDAPYEPLLPTDNGKMAHRACALFTPETWVSEEGGVERILGVNGIDRARLDLKCNFCRSKRGACFQCASKKCTRAFHATCALAAGVQVDMGMVPTFGEDGTEYFEEGFDLRCRFHRPKRAKNTDVEALENSKLINNYAKGLRKGDAVQMQYLQGDIFAGIVVENRPAELSLLVDILPEGDKVEIEWKWLVVLDPIDSLRPKPSSSAIPMPEGMNKKSVSIENRQDGIPNMEEPFHDNPANKWAEFVNLDIPPSGYARGVIKNKEQVAIDMYRPDHVYFYLPGPSTEAKSRWTDDLQSQTPVPKADFMDRVKPATAYRPPVQTYGNVYNTHSANIRQQSSMDRPYVYKPKTSMPSNTRYSVDPQAMPTQRQFTENAHHRTSFASMSGSYGSLPPLSQQPSESNTQGSGPLRPFPGDAYYSSRVLPAAVPGEYSSFSEQVRRNSGIDERRPSLGMQSHNRQPSSGSPGSASTAPGANAFSGTLRSPSSAHGHPQAHHARAAPGPLSNGNYDYAPLNGTHRPREDLPVTKTLPQLPLPATSNAACTDAVRNSDVPWTPPSRLYTSQSNPSLPSYLSNDRYSQQNSPAYPMPRQQATYQSAEDFRSQMTQHSERPSVANRYGTHERMLRDIGTNASSRPLSDAAKGPYQSTTTAGGASNGFQIPKEGQQQEGQPNRPDDQQYGGFGTSSNGSATGITQSQSCHSPKAPDYSPLSQTQSPAHGNWAVPQALQSPHSQQVMYQQPRHSSQSYDQHRHESSQQARPRHPAQDRYEYQGSGATGMVEVRSNSQQMQREMQMEDVQQQIHQPAKTQIQHNQQHAEHFVPGHSQWPAEGQTAEQGQLSGRIPQFRHRESFGHDDQEQFQIKHGLQCERDGSQHERAKGQQESRTDHFQRQLHEQRLFQATEQDQARGKP